MSAKVQLELKVKWLKQVNEQLQTFKTYQDKGLSDERLGKEAVLYILMKYGGEPIQSITTETLENAQNDYLKILLQETDKKNDSKQGTN